MSTESIFLDKNENEILGFLDKRDVAICEITTETTSNSYNVSIEKSEDVQHEEGKFICYPAENLVHRK